MFSAPPKYLLGPLTQWVEDHFQLSKATLLSLPSERDAVFLVQVTNHPKYILKIANPDESWDFLEAQNGMMERLAKQTSDSCQVIVNRFGKTISQWVDLDGRPCAVRLLSFVPGEVLAEVSYRSPELLENIGSYLGRLDAALIGFHHSALVRTLPWDLQQGRQVVQQLRPHVPPGPLVQQIERCLQLYDRDVAPVADDLPRSVIHNDANDHNILVEVTNDVTNDCVTGLIDFGDSLESWTVGELAITLAYLLLDTDDVWAVIVPVVRGYHRQRPLTEVEMQVLFPLVLLRLCTSVVMAAEGLSRDPDNRYLQISQQPVQATLPRLLKISTRLATAVIRDACDLPPVAHVESWTQWLTTKRGKFSFPLDLPPDAVGRCLDLSCESELLVGASWPISEPELSRTIVRTLKDAPANYGIGRYFEPRALYQSSQFGTDAHPSLRRTIHLGMDLFAPAGVAVRAVASGVVHAVAKIDLPLDYGTLVVLRHEWPAGPPFFTLYGHLASFADDNSHSPSADQASPTSRLPAPPIGAVVEAGQCLGVLGTPEENGGWPPHLHFQILMDDLDDPVGFPGVGQSSISRVWAALSPNPQWLLDLPACRTLEYEQPNTDLLAVERSLSRERQNRLGRNVRTSYREPLHMVKGRGVYLYDALGREYLDAYNNVPHVGHSHPEVIAVAHRQLQLLNTNTRYLHQHAVRFAENLAKTLPEKLNVCFFVTSASEANELALRLARAYAVHQLPTNGPSETPSPQDVIVMEAAYHGHTTSLIDCSPYKHAGPGGRGRPDWVHVVDLPDVYRGKHRGADAGNRYAQEVEQKIHQLQTSGRPLTAWIAETCPSVGGQILLPAGYLSQVYAAVRNVGGICIADEVQTGYGRLGSAFYGFEMHHVVPDVVVLGKPIGNGYPLAAVVTSREIADAFDNGMEFFSTFGGSTVACAVGDCVLEITKRNQLPQHALTVGEYLRSEFLRLQSQFPWIGDVRGSGLFWGLDLVMDPETREPDPRRARFIKQRLCDRGILIGTDGTADNVLKIRPPMPFSISNAQHLLRELEATCRESRKWDPAKK
jgi:4-aminobutyrate aminotransferase-like enzyme/Ser/Thr protein kinase RdoA (MazF antagonist)